MRENDGEGLRAKFLGIDAIVYGVEDMDQCCRFYDAWGLRTLRRTEDMAIFTTCQGQEVVLKNLKTQHFAVPALQPGAGLREVIWGVASARCLDRVAEQLSPSHRVERCTDGSVHSIDPYGYGIGFRVSQRSTVEAMHNKATGSTRTNFIGSRQRINESAEFYARAEPIRIGHVVFEVSGPDALRAGEEFYLERLKFSASDRYVGRALFCRCAAESDHHNVALLTTKNQRTQFEHIAFEVRDIHEVFGGGLHFAEQGWTTAIGPGRHKLSSAYFWYFDNPCGGQTEYFSDSDFLDEDWVPRNLPTSPDSIAEWALFGGVGRFKGFPRN